MKDDVNKWQAAERIQAFSVPRGQRQVVVLNADYRQLLNVPNVIDDEFISVLCPDLLFPLADGCSALTWPELINQFVCLFVLIQGLYSCARVTFILLLSGTKFWQSGSKKYIYIYILPTVHLDFLNFIPVCWVCSY